MQASPFEIRGVVEGFYGVYYTFPERNDLIRFLGRHGYNLYIYGPKNDRQHRTRWWEPYPDDIRAQFAETVAVARPAGVTFCYAISPISYAGAEDFGRLAAKLRSFYDLGVRSFSVLMDDLTPDVPHDADDKSYLGYAGLHAEICNRLHAWLHDLSDECALSMCPIDYYGTPPFSHYLRALGEGLDRRVDVFYTGPQVCSPAIAAADVEEYARAVRRRPVLWDNYPANDLTMRSELHLGPIRNRDARLPDAARGVVVNPMIQAEASKIPLRTYADFLGDPRSYDREASWERALAEVGGRSSFEALRQFAENARTSIFEPAEGPRLAGLAVATIESLRGGEPFATSGPVRALARHLASLDEGCYFLKNRMPNLRLRAELLPWIEALEDWVWLGKRALKVLELIDRGEPLERPARLLEKSLEEIGQHSKRIGGRALLPLARYAREQIDAHGPGGRAAGQERHLSLHP